MTPPPVTVLYITGWCRNGSTLIGNILNEIDGLVHVGELHYLWKNMTNQGTNTLCGCGTALAACHVWCHVLSTTAADARVEDYANRVMACQPAVRTRHTWEVLRYRGGRDGPLAQYADILSRTYRAIHEVTGAKVIVDSGKYPAEAALLPHVPGIKPVYLHVVRDPRASAYSWSKPKKYIPSMSPARSTAYWVSFNLASDAIRRRYPQDSLYLRYEDFVSNPAESIDRILTLIQASLSLNPLQGRAVTLGINHTVTGNPDRFERGPVTVHAQDVDWRKELPKRSALIATLVALPFMARYGYR